VQAAWQQESTASSRGSASSAAHMMQAFFTLEPHLQSM
jgi:hypothetical protein